MASTTNAHAAQDSTEHAGSQVPASSAPKADTTFRNYNPSSAQAYLAHRKPYTDPFIKLVISSHTSTGGALGTLLDVGCGPGLSTLQLAPHFQHAIAADPGEAMIATARAIDPPLLSASGEKVHFEVSGAEDLASPDMGVSRVLAGLEGQAEGSVDLITAATAAHWFNIAPFYVQAAKLLRPGGSIVIFANGAGFHPDPESIPNHEQLKEMWRTEFEEGVLGEYMNEGNRLARGLYKDLKMPWDLLGGASEELSAEDREALAVFDEGKSWRETINETGERDERFKETDGWLSHYRAPWSLVKMTLGTASPVTRWRAANKEKLEKGEVRDLLDVAFDRMFEVIREGGHEVPEVLGASIPGVLICIKKKKNA